MKRFPRNVDLGTYRDTWRYANDISKRDTPCYRITNEDATPKIYIYDVIGGWDLDAASFVRELNEITADNLNVHINSPGGFVYDGVAIYEALRDHSAAVNVKIDGLAASAASFIAMAGDSIVIAKPGRMMIHDAQVLAYGSPAVLREAADLGDEISDDIAGIYADRTSTDQKTWRKRMKDETWYSSAKAVEVGLADSVKQATESPTENNVSRLIKARHRAMLTTGRN